MLLRPCRAGSKSGARLGVAAYLSGVVVLSVLQSILPPFENATDLTAEPSAPDKGIMACVDT